MALQKSKLQRKFVLEKNNQKITLADPSPDMSADEVMSFYSNTYPELATSTVSGPKYEDDFAVYSFRTTVGTKG